ncbi:MAG: TnsA endonuclease N-terminal domain-containing protein [Rhodocyclaceae bacterium]|nr:TnsA endonuclease N-terminal domain-containing protein [Rhodocyclaceae bacterium]
MRTTRRFTPHILERYRALGRGTGTFEQYIPWHRVSRSDPASRGRSHLLVWRGRHRELLSDGELIAFFFTTRVLGPNDDVREQFPLSLDSAPHELAAYDARFASLSRPGTLDIAADLGIPHPQCRGGGQCAPWVMTTDLLLMRRAADGKPSLLAVSCKDRTPLSRRTTELLQIEQAYWTRRGVAWLLLTPHLYETLVAQTLQRTWPWALGTPVDSRALEAAYAAVHRWYGHSLTFTLQRITDALGDSDVAQRALWQSIWSGRVAADLRRGWRQHIPLRLLPQADFDALNPVLSGRSAWI